MEKRAVKYNKNMSMAFHNNKEKAREYNNNLVVKK